MAHNNFHITRHNYEEYFLLYVDRELPTAGMQAVEDFVLQNPDLASELEALRQATLTPPVMNFGGKQALYKPAVEITLDNYTEFFTRHADNELNSDELAAMRQFIARHPQLQQELELFENTRLPVEHLVFDDKLGLYKNTGAAIINQHNYTEFFALYADNELPAADKQAVEAFAAATPGMQTELGRFMLARLQPDMQVVFPGKAALYRGMQQERRRVVPMWLRFAAAAAILVCIAWFAFNGAGGSSSGNGKTPIASNKQPQPNKQPGASGQPVQNNNNPNADAGMAQTTGNGHNNNNNSSLPNNELHKTGTTGNKNEGVAVTKQGAERNTNRNEQRQPVITPVAPDNNNSRNIAGNNNKPEQPQLPPELKNILKPQQSQEAAIVQNNTQVQPDKSSEKPPVQHDVAAVKTAVTAAPDEATGNEVAIMNMPADNMARKNGLRGLGRKVSRFFERKIKNFGNSPVSVGGFEIAVAK